MTTDGNDRGASAGGSIAGRAEGHERWRYDALRAEVIEERVVLPRLNSAVTQHRGDCVMGKNFLKLGLDGNGLTTLPLLASRGGRPQSAPKSKPRYAEQVVEQQKRMDPIWANLGFLG